jgi:hypothetical protein
VPVLDVGVAPGDEIAGRGVQALPERLPLALVAALAGQHVCVPYDPGTLGGGDRDGVVRRSGVDDEQLIDERHRLHERRARRPHDGSDGGGLVEGGEDG